ncbi:23S rRNA (adenine(1618)-N(6))-methyltransferase RlmF [Urechidicola croceus]|uniref:Ribosomal RNA large subunit methyltransferase F n=1 Tax=Urechidicola croceus TaxID=1850246 RepID=A0A1D8P5G7_9FLAO|nr:23S rRNA (adenine(1618)-N(6))-methyltransferase RlmF [Urechidicola croceus]AOW19818.1 23S rRNA (adenine(1618)-N(6))-methyltransferase [Urechidicola croceus]
MHPNNIHNTSYDFKNLIKVHDELKRFVFINDYGNETIDFSDNASVLHLNKAILMYYYKVNDWNIPKNYLCPPIPGRADYIHHIADLFSKKDLIGLDIGVGANCIYPILGSQIYNWKMVGADINIDSVNAAKTNIISTKKLEDNIEIRHQENNANIFEGIIHSGEHFNFTMCNPPFHSSKEEASKGSLRKLKNLHNTKTLSLNFGGQANELWCNGGEALFIKRMIKQSVTFKSQVEWFTTLVSQKNNLPKIYKQLDKLKTTHKTIEMSQGSKKSRFIAWKFN